MRVFDRGKKNCFYLTSVKNTYYVPGKIKNSRLVKTWDRHNTSFLYCGEDLRGLRNEDSGVGIDDTIVDVQSSMQETSKAWEEIEGVPVLRM